MRTRNVNRGFQQHQLRNGKVYGSFTTGKSKMRHRSVHAHKQIKPRLFELRNIKKCPSKLSEKTVEAVHRSPSDVSIHSQRSSDSGLSDITIKVHVHSDADTDNESGLGDDISLSSGSEPPDDPNGAHPLANHKIVNLKDLEDSETGSVLKSNGIVGAFAYAGADIPGSIGKVLKSYGTFADFQSHDMKGSHRANVTKSTSILSLANGASVLTGYLTYQQGKRTLKTASKVNDYYGMQQGRLSKARAPFEALSGAIGMPTAIMSIAGLNTTAKTMTAAAALGTAASVASGLYYIGLIASSSLALHEIRKNSNQFLKEADAGNTDQAIEELVNVLTLDENDLEKVLDKAFEHCSSKKEDKRTLDSKKLEKALKKVVDGVDEDGGQFILHASEYEAIEKKVIQLLADGSIEDGDVETVQALMISEVKKKYAAKQQSFLRTFGSEAFQKLIEIKRKEQSNAQPEDLKAEKEEVIALAKKTIKNSKILHGFLLAGVISALVLTVLGNIFTGGIVYLVMQAVSLAVAAILTGIDFFALYQTYSNSKVNTKEKIALVAIALLMVSAIVAANVFSGGIAGFVLIGVVAAIFSGTVIYGVYKSKKEMDDTVEEKDTDEIEKRRLQNLLDEMIEFEAKRAERRRQEALQAEKADLDARISETAL